MLAQYALGVPWECGCVHTLEGLAFGAGQRVRNGRGGEAEHGEEESGLHGERYWWVGFVLVGLGRLERMP